MDQMELDVYRILRGTEVGLLESGILSVMAMLRQSCFNWGRSQDSTDESALRMERLNQDFGTFHTIHEGIGEIWFI